MNITFVSGNRETLPEPTVPLGILCVMAATDGDHRLVDLFFADDPVATLTKALRDDPPQLVAIGMRNIQNNDYSGLRDNIAYYQSLVAAARQVSGAPIVVGGSGFSVMPNELMATLGADYGIAGEGEGAFPLLVEALDDGATHAEALRKVPGLCFFDRSLLISNPPASKFLDMNELVSPDRSLADARYYQQFGMESVQTKRGCPLHCEYCTYPIIEGRVGRTREPSAIVDEMFHSLDVHPDINHFFIVDSVFNLPRRHAKDVCHELIKRAWRVPWTCYANPLGFDDELAELAAEAGCAGMEIGSDSGCEEVLARMRKGFTLKDVVRVHRQCQTAGIPDCHSFILGTRGESLQDVEQSLDFIVDLDPFAAILMVWIDDYEALDPAYRQERLAFRRQVEEVIARRQDRYSHWAIPPLKMNFGEKLFERLRREGCHGPMWQHMRTQKSFERQRARLA